MTGFGDVNVGDKVRLTDRDGEEHVIRVYAVAPTVGDGWAITGNHGTYHSDNWSVEVLEPAPKPLPDVPGMYTDGHCEYLLSEAGNWKLVTVAGTYARTAEQMWDPAWCQSAGDLQPLVSVSAVEEARNEVVKEIVKYAQGLSFVLAGKIDRKFRREA